MSKKIFTCYALILTILSVASPSKAARCGCSPGCEIEAGDFYDQSTANLKCPFFCDAYGGWNGKWTYMLSVGPYCNLTQHRIKRAGERLEQTPKVGAPVVGSLDYIPN